MITDHIMLALKKLNILSFETKFTVKDAVSDLKKNLKKNH